MGEKKGKGEKRLPQNVYLISQEKGGGKKETDPPRKEKQRKKKGPWNGSYKFIHSARKEKGRGGRKEGKKR